MNHRWTQMNTDEFGELFLFSSESICVYLWFQYSDTTFGKTWHAACS